MCELRNRLHGTSAKRAERTILNDATFALSLRKRSLTRECCDEVDAFVGSPYLRFTLNMGCDWMMKYCVVRCNCTEDCEWSDVVHSENGYQLLACTHPSQRIAMCDCRPPSNARSTRTRRRCLCLHFLRLRVDQLLFSFTA